MAIIKEAGFIPPPTKKILSEPQTGRKGGRFGRDVRSVYSYLDPAILASLTPEAEALAKSMMVIARNGGMPTTRGAAVAGAFLPNPNQLSGLEAAVRGLAGQQFSSVKGGTIRLMPSSPYLAPSLPKELIPGTVLHEFLHAFDYGTGRKLSSALRKRTGTSFLNADERFANTGAGGPSNIPSALRDLYKDIYK